MRKWLKQLSHIVPDKLYLLIKYKVKLGKWPNLKYPKLYTEKLQWLKLYDRNPEYTKMVDKLEMKAYVTEKIGEKYVVPTLGVWEKFEEIDFSSLPDKFVLKCTHNSGGLIICNNKSLLNMEDAKKKINSSLNKNYFWHSREWPYKNVKPRILAEKYMEDNGNADIPITDYKFFCFYGSPKILYLTQETSSEPYADCYDMEFNKMDLQIPDPNSKIIAQKPKRFEEMKHIAGKLSEGIPHLRIDLYDINDQLYVGELTFFHYGGLAPVFPEKWNQILGDWIKLPLK